MSSSDTNEKLELVQAKIDEFVKQVHTELDDIKKDLSNPDTKPGGKRRLEEMDCYISRAFTKTSL